MKERPPRYGPCEAPNHVDNCDGIGSTTDHFTPKCIGKLLGWDKKTIDAPDNIQMLSPQCHTAKDRDTPLRKEVLRLQLKEGVSIPFPVHQQIFDRHNLEPLHYYQQTGEIMEPGVEYNIDKKR